VSQTGDASRPPGALWHASCVAYHDRGVLILGASGSGKSALALALIALGAELVADDRVWLDAAGGALVARAPERIRGLIEARGVGLVNLTARAEARIALAVDLDAQTAERLPDLREFCITAACVPLIAGKNKPNLHHILMSWLRTGTYPILVTPEG